MARPALGVGVIRHGNISTAPHKSNIGFVARCRVNDGKKVHSITAHGLSAAEATEALLTKLETWTPPKRKMAAVVGPDGEPLGAEVDTDIERVGVDTTLGDAVRLWLAEVSADPELRLQTRDYWRRVARQTVLKDERFSAKLVSTLTAGDAARFIAKIKHTTPGQARKARSMLKLVIAMAVLDGDIPHNVILDTPRVSRGKKKVRALTQEEFHEFRAALRAWREASIGRGGSPRDPSFLVTDVAEALAATGLRINELLGLRPQDLDLDHDKPTATVRGTLVSVTGHGITWQEAPKTESGARCLTLPALGVAAFRRQLELNSSDEFVFTTSTGAPVSEHNITRVFRAARPAALAFVTPHTFRRSVATWLKAADATAAATAQLGHSSEAVTEEFYIQQQTRGTVDNSVLLQSILEDTNQGKW